MWGEVDALAVARLGNIVLAMQGAIISILRVAGFTVDVSTNDLSPLDVQVFAGPPDKSEG